MPGQLYYATYGRAHALASLDLLYPRSERAGLAAQRGALLEQARGATFELAAAGGRECRATRAPDPPSGRPAAARARALRHGGLHARAVPGPRPRGHARADRARALEPGGQLLFLEHVRADSPRLARWQDRLERPWRYLAIDCHCNRDTLAAIEASPLEVEHVERGRLAKLGPLVTPLIAGTARRH